MLQPVLLKVCGMREAENINLLAALKPNYIGFIFYEFSKRYADKLDSDVLKALPSSIKKTGVFVNASLEEIIEKIEKFELDAVQLHGRESAEFCTELKPFGLEIIKAFGIDAEFDFASLKDFEGIVDYYLFDTKTKLHGGSGETFDWTILERYSFNTPYFLSGGLSAENIKEVKSINDSRLFALDLNSRFEIAPGLKDIEKLTAVFNEIRIPR